MPTITNGLNHSTLRPSAQICNELPRGGTKKLWLLFASFLFMAAVALNVWPAMMGTWTLDASSGLVATDVFDIEAESWTHLTAPVPAISPIHQQKVSETYGKLPLSFEVNEGQTDPQVKFLSRGSGYDLFLTPTEAVLTLRKPKNNTEAPLFQRGLAGVKNRRHASLEQAQIVTEEPPAIVHMKLVGANPHAAITGLDGLPGKVNYFRGSDPKQWRTNISTYGKVKYAQVYPGIDLVYYGNPQQLEHDFVVTPGANPSAIALEFTGAGKVSIDSQGDLVLADGAGEIRLQKPMIYQEVDGQRRNITGSYRIMTGQRVGFQVGTYDATKPLVIDPVLVYATYLGGSSDFGDEGYGIAIDAAGNAYVTGITSSTDFLLKNPIQANLRGSQDVFVAKINADGTALVYATYLGGSEYDGEGPAGVGIAVDVKGNAYITGITWSPDFPGTANSPIQATRRGIYDAFVAKLNATGTALVYSTYLGGSRYNSNGRIAVDAAGNTYVTGTTSSTDFPLKNPIQANLRGEDDAFVAKINADGTALVYATYLGGSSSDEGYGLAVDADGDAYVTGSTDSPDFPGTASSPIQSILQGRNAFVVKLNAAGTALVYATYLGGFYDYGFAIAVDSSGNAYITGLTNSNYTAFPGTAGSPIQSSFGGGNFDAFVAKINTAGTVLVYSTYLGGSVDDIGDGIAVDADGDAYVTGVTGSPNFPGTANSPIQSTLRNSADGFVAKLNATGTALVYSTYLGGSNYDEGWDIAVDASGAYIAGITYSPDFPGTANSPIQSTLRSPGGNAFAAKLSSDGVSANQPPVVNAGEDQTRTLDNYCSTPIPGKASDPDNDSLTYRWLEGQTVLSEGAVGAAGEAPLNLSCAVPLSVGPHTLTLEVSDDKAIASDTMILTITYPYSGFFQPVDNPSTVNSLKAGAAVPVKFSLGGNRGLAILADQSPSSQPMGCGGESIDPIEQTVTAGNSSLSYDATTNQYIYVWKTDTTWIGTCRQFTLTLTDGTSHKAYFQFK